MSTIIIVDMRFETPRAGMFLPTYSGIVANETSAGEGIALAKLREGAYVGRKPSVCTCCGVVRLNAETNRWKPNTGVFR